MDYPAELLPFAKRKLELEIAHLEMDNQDTQHDLNTKIAAGDWNHVYTFYNPVIGQTVLDAIAVFNVWARRDPGCDIEIVLNSPGGSVMDGFALYDFILLLRQRGHRVTITVFGQAASMAAILLMAGDVRRMTRNAFLMVHQPSLHFGGGMRMDVADMQDELKMLERYRDRGLDILSGRANIGREELSLRWLKTDWYLDADEALQYGFVDEVV